MRATIFDTELDRSKIEVKRIAKMGRKGQDALRRVVREGADRVRSSHRHESRASRRSLNG
jgi:hypothetical protein